MGQNRPGTGTSMPLNLSICECGHSGALRVEYNMSGDTRAGSPRSSGRSSVTIAGY